MKTKFLFAIIVFLLTTEFGYSQTQYMNTDFEKTDTLGKLILKWEAVNRDVEYKLDSVNKVSGNLCLYMKRNPFREDEIAEDFTFMLPKSFYKGMRTLEISVKIREGGNSYPLSGLWCKVKKKKILTGWASTYKGLKPFPLTLDEGSTNAPIIPWSWNTYSFTITIEEDPDEVQIGGFCFDDAWFDDIQININGNLVNNLVFPLKMD